MTNNSEAAGGPAGGRVGWAHPRPGQLDSTPNGPESQVLEAALGYAQRGWAVFPLRPRSKEPLTPHGFKDATTDPSIIRAWWQKWPDANLGVVTGDRSGLLVLDIDAQGTLARAEMLRDLERRFGPLPEETVTVKTGGGGMHLYFRCPPGARSGRVTDGVDVKGVGGYVVAPPSVHRSGQRYAWEVGPDDAPLADPPAWLVAELARREGPGSGGETAGGIIPEGRRNVTLTSLAGAMRRRGMSQEAIEAALLVENARRCVPPLPEDEVRQIARSVGRYGPGKSEVTTTEKAVVSHLVEVPASEIRAAGVAGGDPLEYLPFLDLDGYIVKGWAHLVAGYPKAGKTELLTRLIGQWTDEQVLYFTEEPQSIWAARLAMLPGDWSHVTLVFALGAEPEAILERIQSGNETVVVVDTVRNLLDIEDETDNSEIARVLNPVIATCRGKDKTLLLAHHIRKGGGEHGEGITGGHAFLGVVDIALEVLRDGGNDLQRKVRGWGRVITIPELLYQQEADGVFRPLGAPSQVALEGVKERLLEVLNGDWQSRKEILAALDDPKPSLEQLRLALEALVDEGAVERDPAQHKRGATYRYRLPGGQVTYHGPPLSGNFTFEGLADKAELPDRCHCGPPVWAYDPNGRPLCQEHAEAIGIREV